jgi:aspartate/methionine/tyrosine aminotransferase
LSLIGDAFVDKGDALVYPDKNWGNYALNYVVRHQAKPVYFPLFGKDGFNLEGLEDSLKTLMANGAGKAIVLLNFPNNPTGYAPTEEECARIADALLKFAEAGMKLVVIVDDAYYSLFHKDNVCRQSLFTKLAGMHGNLLAIKADAATKEVYVWGLRVGFITFSIGGVAQDSPVFDALNAKFGGLIRAGISNCSALSQRLVLNALKSPDFYRQRAQKAAIMKERALEVERVLGDAKYASAWQAYPFNSGYFMCLKINAVNAQDLRVHLLDKYGVGTIAINDTDLRIAFSCIGTQDVQELFDTILKAWQDLTI